MTTTVDPRAKLSDTSLSGNEVPRDRSDYLYGTIKNDLTNDFTGGFTADNFQLIRSHGIYEQDNRDIRVECTDQKLESLKNMMLRCRLLGGIITPAQWLGIDEFAGDHTIYGSIRLINRQIFQCHGVLKIDLKLAHQPPHKLGLDSITTASDVGRNVLYTSNPVQSPLYQEAYEWAKRISMHLLPYTMAYADVWLDGEKMFTTEPIEPRNKKIADDVESTLGKTYLSRKFKTVVAILPDNNVDTHSNDLGLVATEENGRLVGLNALVGGGLSSEHGNTKIYPNTLYEFGFIPLEYTPNTAEVVVSTQRGWGNRSDRKAVRTRYTFQHVGVEAFKEGVEKCMSIKFQPIRSYASTHRGDHIGWVKGLEGNWHLTLFIENGRLLDYPGRPLKIGVREIARIYPGDFRPTADQDLVVANIPPELKDTIDKVAKGHGLISKSITIQRENSMACAALPTCPLVMAEAERFLSSFFDKIDEMFVKYGLEDEYIALCTTDCPNDYGRAMPAEIGLVGKAVGRYNLYAGDNREGTRIPRLLKENITGPETLGIVDGWVGNWTQNRSNNEGFGDFAIRTGIVEPVLDAPRNFWA